MRGYRPRGEQIAIGLVLKPCEIDGSMGRLKVAREGVSPVRVRQRIMIEFLVCGLSALFR